MFSADVLNNKVVLITGGGTGLGKAIAVNAARYGAKLILVGRREDVLTKTADEIRLTGGEVLTVGCDVRFHFEVDTVIETALKHYGRIDVLINNAAANFVAPTENLSSNAFKLVMDTVLMGAVNFTLGIGKNWIETKTPGLVLNILTTYAQTGSAFVVPSACAKAGVENMIRSLSSEWGKYMIRFLGIAPGPFPTEGAWQQLMLDDPLIDQDTQSYASQRIPVGRVGDPQELADLAVFLMSPMASFINGEIIRIDGGEAPNLAGQFSYLNKVSSEVWNSKAKRLKRTGSKRKAA